MPLFNIPNQVWALIKDEYKNAIQTNPAFHSPHEGLAVIEDQFEDLKRQVFMPRSRRSTDEMRKEAVQVATMAIRFIVDCTFDKTQGVLGVNPTEGHGDYIQKER